MNIDFERINYMMGSFKNFGCSIETLKKSLKSVAERNKHDSGISYDGIFEAIERSKKYKQKEKEMIEPNKQYETMDGSEARVYATDGGGDTPVHGAVKTTSGWIASVWDKDGNNPTLSDYDLIEKWEPREGEYCWFSSVKSPLEMVLSKFSHKQEDGKFVTQAFGTFKYCFQYEYELPKPIAESIDSITYPYFDKGE